MARFTCPVLVGRQAELAHLSQRVTDAERGRGGVVAVVGEAGVGKSRLLAEIAAYASGRRATVLSGRCVPSEAPVPYRPLAEALVAVPSATLGATLDRLGGFGAALAPIVPGLGAHDTLRRAESPVVLAEALLRTLRSLAAKSSLLLVEDVQWADPETLHVIEYLADHATEAQVLVVCSLRDGGAAGVLEALTRVEARRGLELLTLEPLSPAETVEMALTILEAAKLDDEIARLLRESAEGVPFFVEEILATAATNGALVRDADAWHLAGPVHRVVPRAFAIGVRQRLQAMGPDGRRLLGCAALLGRSFDWQLAARAAGLPVPVANAALGRALGCQLLAVDGGAFQFRHALTREAVLGELLPYERAEQAARCLSSLEGAFGPSPEEGVLAADLAEAAGFPERAALSLLEAGRNSLSRGALETAAMLLRRGLTLATSGPVRADILEALAQAASEAGDLTGTRASVEQLLEALGTFGPSPKARLAQAHLLLARCAVAVTHFQVAHEELDRARALAVGEGRYMAARIGAVRAQLAIGEGRTDEAEELAKQAASDAEATRQPETVCEALEVASRCARSRDLDEAKLIGERAMQVAERAGLAYWRVRALYQVGVVEMFVSYGTETIERARREAERLGAVATATSLDLEVTAALEAQHRLAEARATCERCIEMSRVLELRGVQAVAHAFMAMIEAGHGSRKRMEDAISEARSIAGDDIELDGACWGDARAIASLAAEDRGRAREELEQAAAVYKKAPPSTSPRLGTALLAALDAIEGREPEFEAAGGITRLNAQGAGYVAYAEAAVLGRAGRRSEALAAVGRGDQHLARCPWYRHLMRRLVAEAAIRDGWGEPVAWVTEAASYFDDDGSERLAAACRGLLRRSGARVSRPTARLQALSPALRRAGVTPREAEVLALLGKGLSNGEIAARLYLSHRTVEQHISALKHKLGTRTRAELAVRVASGS